MSKLFNKGGKCPKCGSHAPYKNKTMFYCKKCGFETITEPAREHKIGR